jgi:hypothetical protein
MLVIIVRPDFLETRLEQLLLDNDVLIHPVDIDQSSEPRYQLTFQSVHLQRLDRLDERYKRLIPSIEQQGLLEEQCTVYLLNLPLQQYLFYIQAADVRESFLALATFALRQEL